MQKWRRMLVLGVVCMFLGIVGILACGKPKVNSDAKVSSYEVLLPEGYESEDRSYPVVYVMPQDGYKADDSGIAEKLHASMEAIIVRPVLEQGVDVQGAMGNLVKEIDETYRTASDKKFRAVVGTGTGGYLAYVLGLAEDAAFSGIASIRGDFVSDANPWYAIYGNIADALDKMHGKDEAVFENFYTYIDAPVSDAWTNMEGSTNDIGAQFIGYGTTSAAHEFTVRKGTFDEAFLDESVNRVADRLNTYMMADLVSGQVTLTPSTLSEDEATAKVGYTLQASEVLGIFSATEIPAEVKISVIDPNSGELLAESVQPEQIQGKGSYSGEVAVDNKVNGSYSVVQLSLQVLGTELDLGMTYLNRSEEPVIDGDYQHMNLSGDWYFNYTAKKNLDVAGLTAEEYQNWSIVQPGLGNWVKGYGNISEENVSSPMGDDYFNYMIVGNGYYVKEFVVPKAFNSKDLILSIGYVDDRCEVFVNGTKVGATGMDDNGNPTKETTWAQYSYFEVDESLLAYDKTNTVVVRAWNDTPYGAGGWYGGPIGLYSRTAFEKPRNAGEADGASRFVEASFSSEYAASALGVAGPVENEYLVYLPKDYYETDRYYPTVYLLHQFNSDHTSYRIDKVDKIFDEGIENGLFDEMIVVVPNSEENSWWAGDWERMLTEELIPLIDSEYRTIRDARYRLTAGCSMGGQGAFSMALHNPDYFSGAISFFGAFSYGEKNSPNYIATQESVEFLDYYTMYFICGNQDSYGFGVPAIELSQMLEEKGIEHGFFIENGGHDGGFYLPYFAEAFAYTRTHMYQSGEVGEVLSGQLTLEANGQVAAKVVALPEIEAYRMQIPESSYTKNTNPELVIPLVAQLLEDGEVVHAYVTEEFRVGETGTYQYDFSQFMENGKSYTIVYKAAFLDKMITLDEITCEF